jgi:hypothetical protein
MIDDKNQIIRSMRSFEVTPKKKKSKTKYQEGGTSTGEGCKKVTTFKTTRTETNNNDDGGGSNGGGRNLGLEHLGRKIRWGAKNVARKIKRAF